MYYEQKYDGAMQRMRVDAAGCEGRSEEARPNHVPTEVFNLSALGTWCKTSPRTYDQLNLSTFEDIDLPKAG